jgi:hypothetical protein
MNDLKLDKDDLHLLKKYNYYKNNNGYYCRKKGNKTIFLHHDITGLIPNKMIVVDHINQNILDNRRDNLRVVSRSHNAINKGKIKRKHKQYSTFKGVSLDKSKKCYRAYCTINKKRKHIGRFINEIEAARAYNLFIIINLGYTFKLNETSDNYDNFTPFPVEYIQNEEWDRYIYKKGSSYRFSIDGSTIQNEDINILKSIRFLFYRNLLNLYKYQTVVPTRISCE